MRSAWPVSISGQAKSIQGYPLRVQVILNRYQVTLDRSLELFEERRWILRHSGLALPTRAPKLGPVQISQEMVTQILHLPVGLLGSRIDALNMLLDALDPLIDALEPILDALDPLVDPLEPILDALDILPDIYDGIQKLLLHRLQLCLQTAEILGHSSGLPWQRIRATLTCHDRDSTG